MIETAALTFDTVMTVGLTAALLLYFWSGSRRR